MRWGVPVVLAAAEEGGEEPEGEDGEEGESGDEGPGDGEGVLEAGGDGVFEGLVEWCFPDEGAAVVRGAGGVGRGGGGGKVEDVGEGVAFEAAVGEETRSRDGVSPGVIVRVTAMSRPLRRAAMSPTKWRAMSGDRFVEGAAATRVMSSAESKEKSKRRFVFPRALWTWWLEVEISGVPSRKSAMRFAMPSSPPWMAAAVDGREHSKRTRPLPSSRSQTSSRTSMQETPRHAVRRRASRRRAFTKGCPRR